MKCKTAETTRPAVGTGSSECTSTDTRGTTMVIIVRGTPLSLLSGCHDAQT